MTSVPASEEAEEEDSYEAVYVHTTETVLNYQYNPLCEDLVLCDHCASASIFLKHEPTHQHKTIWHYYIH